VKAMFNDLAFRDEMRLSAVNSINWARVMAQVVYYFTAAVALGAPRRPVAFSVPTGNFGDVYAGYVAARMGLPVHQLIVATNINDILSRTFSTGSYVKGEVMPTMSPSMDIQVSSNFERLLFDLYGRDGAAVSGLMDEFAATGRFTVTDAALDQARALFDSDRVTEEETAAMIAQTLKRSAVLVDPHTAVGLQAAADCRRDPAVPMVTLSTAHPAKFPAAVKAASGRHPALPERMNDLFDRPERYDRLPNDLDAVKAHIRARARAVQPS
ncbi:MAG TPA: threonine synthase, partial [Sphingomonadales bacterium]